MRTTPSQLATLLDKCTKYGMEKLVLTQETTGQEIGAKLFNKSPGSAVFLRVAEDGKVLIERLFPG